ncbi:MAG TPA: xanthine dehydrogenase family protein subunit M [Miltoncostaeaceae bacterium]|nr:xanthine dehydrogenase family protein subunit M [Miltoncostaeaceae bacterium]
MIPAQFDYVAPTSVAEAVQALQQAGEDAKVLGGGQSFIPVLRLRLSYPETVIDLGRIPELRGVREEGDELVIGAMTRHHDVVRDPLVRQHAALLSEATATVADPAVRHRGTLGGALAHADPAGDLGAPAIALGATLVAEGPSGRRSIPASDFFLDYLETALSPDEILVEVRVPKHTGWGARYEKFNRVAQAWSIVAVAATVRVDGGSIAEARVALTNMGSTPIRATGVEEALAGASLDASAIEQAAARAAEGTDPPSDLNAKADYREHLARVLTRRALTAAAGLQG